jgi:hypothetical protein
MANLRSHTVGCPQPNRRRGSSGQPICLLAGDAGEGACYESVLQSPSRDRIHNVCITGQVRIRQPLGSRERAEGTVAPAIDRAEQRPGLRHGNHADEENLALADVQFNRVPSPSLMLGEVSARSWIG